MRSLICSSNNNIDSVQSILNSIQTDSNAFDSELRDIMLSLSEKELTQLDSVLSDVVIMLFKKALSSSRDVDTFVHYHGYLHEAGRLRVRDFICSFIEEEWNRPLCGALNTCWSDSFAYIFLFEKVSSEDFDRIFGPYGSWMSPVMRSWVFRWKKKEEYLLTDSVISYWNNKASNDINFSFEGYAHYQRIVDYVEKSPVANDILLLIFFIETSSQRLYEQIKDKTILISWLPKADDGLIKKFLLLFNQPNRTIASELLFDIIKSIGVQRSVDLLEGEKDLTLSGFPRDVTIILNAAIETTCVYNSTESSEWHGGYWTWGEGMKHQECTHYRYQVTEYNAAVYSSIEDSIREALIEERHNELINTKISECLSRGISQSVFLLRIRGQDYIALLSLEPNNNSASFLYRAPKQIWKVLVDTETITDD